jgi:mRNA interferase RelE/StbE
MLTVLLSKHAKKNLEKMPLKHARQIKLKIESLMQDPEPHDSQQLVNYSPFRRADRGEYRIIYKVDNNMLSILLVGKRNDSEVYRKMKDILK